MKIFTDSSCDLNKQFYIENNVGLFPLSVDLQGKQYKDVEEIEADEIYAAIRSGEQPKTSQVSPESFLTQFEALAESGEEGLYIAFSSELSGTYNTAVMLKNDVLERFPNLKLTILDTKCASLGQGMLVREAVALRDAGKTYDEIVATITECAPKMQHYFTVKDLDYLAKGGRVSKTSAFVGGLLQIKPILKVTDGKLQPIDKVRGHKKAIAKMIDYVEAAGGDFSNKTIGLCHSDDHELLEDVKAALQERLSPKDFYVTKIGAVIGSHVGLGTVGIFFYGK
ncbi:MAG: DegV family protein [Solibacillus sp.]